MKTAKQKRLEAAGWRVSDATDFLGLSPEEAAYIEFKLNLADKLEAKRKAEGLTQAELAKRLKTSQPRVAYMEKGDSSVSVDLILRGLFSLGVTRRELAKAV